MRGAFRQNRGGRYRAYVRLGRRNLGVCLPWGRSGDHANDSDRLAPAFMAVVRSAETIGKGRRSGGGAEGTATGGTFHKPH